MNTLPAFDWALNLLIVQGAMGAFDTLYHHELTQDLPHRPRARLELAIHAVRSVLYGLVFASIANVAFHGAWVAAVAAVVLVEVGLTLWDFVVEDRSRKLPATERVLHTLLAVNGGALFGMVAMQLSAWAHEPTALQPIDPGWRGWLLSLFAVGVTVSGVRDGIAACRVAPRAPAANPFAGQRPGNVLVTGGTGFIGETLVNQLLDAGHTVTLLARDPLRAAYLFQGRVRSVTSVEQLQPHARFDTVINLAGAPVLGARWSKRRQALLLASRVGVTQALMRWVETAEAKPRTWIQASAIGYYGVRPGDERLDERSGAGTGFMSALCRQWEAAAAPHARHGVRAVVLRLGVVFGPGGALRPMLLPHYFGLGGRFGDGAQVLSWIHRDDVLRIVARAMSQAGMHGVYNAVAPVPLTQRAFVQIVSKVLRRRAWLHVPAAPLRAAMGEMAELLLDGQRVVPARLHQDGFMFRFPTAEHALRDLTNRPHTDFAHAACRFPRGRV
ncbi:TIGR01777 family protein [Burkholderia cenocepacia]|uniref:TIGR01777 family oxidoreductase n=1 Tax=Burkholderia cenocepacia TaxID=95486 RepID=UPI000980ADD5|nr:TIGR01777 family oxidoreductase [Burkholderia cenocepacia]ONR67822.1 TIGR01777 family protein [Burkholderia cenocepacia]ONR72346.1 TIGR01777 family protein [Burkholderia cenocepacia]ONR80776.1 TIGR01777 family protein [Burkholderia cenocepacia]ONR85359.1 TIGR01777 family protein [Burkholderia cenocepacia]ONR88724.1 TIGR01777 family protein [Burkholderia cenocepacia]